MKKIRFYVNSDKPAAAETALRLRARAPELGLAVVDDLSADALVALGGDGTILRAVSEFADLPVLGLNCGGLGYLSSVGEEDFERALKLLAVGRYSVVERRMVAVNGGHPALNDVVITREMSGRTARLDLAADGRLVTSYMADGLIVSTPTGSTAYSLAAGGPVVMPDLDCLVVTPMNPHALGVRPLVVRDTVRLTVTARSRTAGNALTVAVYSDGERVGLLEEGQGVEIARSDRVARLVELEGHDPYGVLTHKLGWSGSNVK